MSAFRSLSKVKRTNDFMLLTAICVLAIPFVFAIGSSASLRGGRVSLREQAHVVE